MTTIIWTPSFAFPHLHLAWDSTVTRLQIGEHLGCVGPAYSAAHLWEHSLFDGYVYPSLNEAKAAFEEKWKIMDAERRLGGSQ